MLKHGRVLIVAGSDSGGGAGIQADIKTVTVLGGYAMTSITAITVQNTLGVQAIYPISPSVIAAQIRAVLREGRLTTVLQPIVDLVSGAAVGYESLARFEGETPQPPDIWFAAAGSVGLGLELELAAVRSALEHLDTLRFSGHYIGDPERYRQKTEVEDVMTSSDPIVRMQGTLADALEMALALGPDEREALGERARAAVLAHYSVTAMQEATLDVYRELLG